jgi:hypothetical protein
VTGNPTPSRTWQWLRDGSSISGATSSTYTLVSADGGADVSVRQTETNALGADDAVSAVVDVPASDSFDPATLFGASDQGAVYDFTDESLLFQDAARTIPVTAPGQPLFSALDISGKNNHINRNAGTPRWQGEPATWEPNLLASPLMESAGEWTAGAGWSVSGGLATKTAGTASALSQSVSLTPGRVYMAQFRVVTRTAGTVFVRLNGTTVVSHFTGYSAAGEYLELLTAVTGNNTFEIWGDATFAGTINTAGLYEVTSFYDMGARGDFNERLLTGNINMSSSNAMTVIVAHKRARRGGNMYVGMVASAASGAGANGERIDRAAVNGVWGYDGAVADIATENDPDMLLSTNYSIYAVRRDTNQAAIADQHRVQFNGIDVGQSNSGGPFTSPTANSATAKISLLSYINTNTMFAGQIYRVIVISRVLTDEELALAVDWCGFDGKFVAGACTGDSTWDADRPAKGVGRGLTSYTTDMIGPYARMLRLEEWGDDTLEQNADWSALTSTNLSKLHDVQISVGLNDIAGRVDSGATVPQILADLQSYINEIRADCPTARLVGFQLPPCRAWLEGRTNAANCIAARDAWNAALVNGTITGLDAVATQHVAQMDDGSGYLLPILNTGASGARDGVHPGELGRLIMGVSARQVRVALGTMHPARAFT